ncbi:MAG: hypothetical protein COA79_10790 [Planctomycetota bacterium]|nr:MAG: hypothetical protein COA79_10790 [Planctomycetota bacterium]
MKLRHISKLSVDPECFVDVFFHPSLEQYGPILCENFSGRIGALKKSINLEGYPIRLRDNPNLPIDSIKIIINGETVIQESVSGKEDWFEYLIGLIVGALKENAEELQKFKNEFLTLKDNNYFMQKDSAVVR